jgi:transposase
LWWAVGLPDFGGHLASGQIDHGRDVHGQPVSGRVQGPGRGAASPPGPALAELGREFHLSATTVANWVREANAADAKDPTVTSEERAELVLLRRQLKAREEELEILGKALAFFARRHDP